MPVAPELGIDLSVNLGNVITMLGAVGAVVWKASSFEARLEKADAIRQEEESNRTKEIQEIKTAINEMKAVVTLVAVQKERLDNQAVVIAEDKKTQNERVSRLERMLDELRHGKGMIVSASP